jgi:hypothetical protein
MRQARPSVRPWGDQFPTEVSIPFLQRVVACDGVEKLDKDPDTALVDIVEGR